MNFESQIQQWVQLDNQLKQLNEKVKEIRNKRNLLEQNIIKYTSTNNLSNSIVKISDGKLKFTNTRVPEPLTFKYLEKTLAEVINSESQINLLMNHIKEKRTIKIIPEIKRFSNN
jgi:seryl-tRNA synthetase